MVISSGGSGLGTGPGCRCRFTSSSGSNCSSCSVALAPPCCFGPLSAFAWLFSSRLVVTPSVVVRLDALFFGPLFSRDSLLDDSRWVTCSSDATWGGWFPFPPAARPIQSWIRICPQGGAGSFRGRANCLAFDVWVLASSTLVFPLVAIALLLSFASISFRYVTNLRTFAGVFVMP